MRNRLLKSVALLSLIAAGLLSTTTAGIAGPYYPPDQRDDLTPQQQSKCPPVDPETGTIPGLAEDKNVSDHKDQNGKVDPKIKDAYMGKWHWDDGKGHDLTIEKWCINSTVWYFSQRIIVSTGKVNKKLTVVVAPGGAGGTVDPGAC